MNKKTKFILFILLIGLIVCALSKFYIEKEVSKNYLPSPLVDSQNMVNAKGEHVDKFVKATFRVINTGQTFEYSERENSTFGDYNGNAVGDCIRTSCKIVYFIESTYTDVGPVGRVAVFNDIDNPAIGNITHIQFYSDGKEVSTFPTPHKLDDMVQYTIHYNQYGKSGDVTYTQNLCIGSQGGGHYCHEPNSYENALAIFHHTNEQNYTSMNLTKKITEAQLKSYQYYTQPDTGEYFPVIQK